jgi:3-hydroxyisobutyrate dehydrogenase-like beta-hydroxyacid dehydrogenase
MSTVSWPQGAPRIGLVGYGEVGRILAEDLRAQDIHVLAFDRKLDQAPLASPLQAHAQAHGIVLMPDARSVAQECDLVISAVTASQAVAVAEACAPACGDAWFLDFNSASPMAKCRAAEAIHAAGGRYVEGAVMTSVPPYRIRVPLILGGPHAQALASLLAPLGFAPQIGSTQLGVASATKMCRSVMIKGMEAMVIESLTTARHYGVENAVLASLAETFPGIDWERQAAYFFQRVIEHGRRRSEEVMEVAETVRDAGLTPWSADGTWRRQAWVADLAEAGVFGAKSSPSFARSENWRTEADRILHRPASQEPPPPEE